MSKVRFKFSVEKITFEYEGDHDTGLVVNRAMNHTLGSLVEAQNGVIDVTPEPRMVAQLPSTATTAPKRRYRKRGKAATTGQVAEAVTNGDGGSLKPVRTRRSQGSSFRDQMYVLIREGYFAKGRTASELNGELSRRGYHFDPKNVASDLLWFVKKNFLSRNQNADGKYAYVQGKSNGLPDD